MTDPTELRLTGAAYERAKQALETAIGQLANVGRRLAALEQEVAESNPDIAVVSRESMRALAAVKAELEDHLVDFEAGEITITLD